MTTATTRWRTLTLAAALTGCFEEAPATTDDAGFKPEDVKAVDLGAAPDVPAVTVMDAVVVADVPVDTGCSSDDVCPAAQHCDPATRACVGGCHSDEGCPSLSVDGGVVSLRCDPVAHACVTCLTSDHCPLGNVCMDRRCVPGCSATRGCPAGATCCGGACVALQTTASHCGACDAACALDHATASCVAGTCAVAVCAAPYANCDGVASNGCETDTRTTVAHCGGCGTACAPASATGACVDGLCGVASCEAGHNNCDGLAANGCEVNTATDLMNCGTCANACGASEACVAGACAAMRSCAELHAARPSLASGAYTIDPDGGGGAAPFTAYCDMASDGGGWTLAIKADGLQPTFVYDSALWTNADTLNGSSANVDPFEMKSAAFASVAFTSVRLAFVDGGTTRAVVIPFRSAPSLLSVFAAGAFEATSISRAGWLGLMASGSLQPYCNREGFNNAVAGYVRVRLGMISNQENDCGSPDSRIGLGGQDNACLPSSAGNAAGNSASCSPENGDRDTRVFAYLFVR